ncbi:MAG: hypothetical protein HRU20_04155 [Pseudomonadales bacterium]|nr:hypothetical protein [Pseudomonadales bacterium]
MLKKDKVKVLDEVWTEERVKAFLDLETLEGVNADFHVLNMAYKNMRLENFEQFLAFFTAAKRDLNAQDEKGRTLLSLIAAHKKAAPYAEALKEAGAV